MKSHKSHRRLAQCSMIGMAAIAFCVCPTSRARAQNSVRLVELKSGETATLSPAPGRYRRATISEDGNLVAYQVVDSSTHFIDVVNSSTHSHRRLPVAYGPADFEMHWSPDGKTLAFRADQQGLHSARLQLLDVTTGAERTLVATLVEAFIWRPDGRAIRYVEHGEKHTVREAALDGSGTSPLRVLESAVSGISGIQLYSYTAALVGSMENGVFLVPLPKGAVTLITKVPGRDRASALRDGRVAVPISQRTELMLGVPGSSIKHVTLPFGMSSYLANVLPNGDVVVCGPVQESRFGIYSVPLASEARVLFAAPSGMKIDWFEVSRDGRYLATTLSEMVRENK